MKKEAINPPFLPAPVAAFNRAYEVTFDNCIWLSISGTASVGPECQTLHVGDFKKQVEQTYANIKGILDLRGFKITDIFKWRVYLKDIDRYYDEYNQYRDAFFAANNISREDMGASVCIEAKICREELLIEIEAEAVRPNNKK